MQTPAQPNDTDAESTAVVLRCISRLSPLERLQAGSRLSDRGRRLALAAIRNRHPDADETEIRLRYSELAHRQTLATHVRSWLKEREGQHA